MSLSTMVKIAEANPTRVQSGYETIQIVGWASPPFYDKTRKVLHWAKEIRFGDAASNALNYDVRVLGRKGVLSMNAVGGMGALPLVRENIDGLVAGVEFREGEKYVDFDPKIDNVAAYTIGGLVAGKVLAKAGFFVLLAKYAKPLMVVGVGVVLWLLRMLGSRRKQVEKNEIVATEKQVVRPPETSENRDQVG